MMLRCYVGVLSSSRRIVVMCAFPLWKVGTAERASSEAWRDLISHSITLRLSHLSFSAPSSRAQPSHQLIRTIRLLCHRQAA